MFLCQNSCKEQYPQQEKRVGIPLLFSVPSSLTLEGRREILFARRHEGPGAQPVCQDGLFPRREPTLHRAPFVFLPFARNHLTAALRICKMCPPSSSKRAGDLAVQCARICLWQPLPVFLLRSRPFTPCFFAGSLCRGFCGCVSCSVVAGEHRANSAVGHGSGDAAGVRASKRCTCQDAAQPGERFEDSPVLSFPASAGIVSQDHPAGTRTEFRTAKGSRPCMYFLCSSSSEYLI